jgi:hypothetical protein
MLSTLIRHPLRVVRALLAFRDYEPQPVTLQSLSDWLAQFDASDRPDVLRLLSHVKYNTRPQVRRLLVAHNENLLTRLRESGVPESSIIYIQMHDAGSSSAAMLSLLRDAARLERRGCHFADWTDVRKLNNITKGLGKGVIIYVDDCSGTGTQFCGVRDFLADYLLDTFSEFFLVISICEEALYKLGSRGVEAVTPQVHSKAERPLHPNSTILRPSVKKRLIDLCTSIDRTGALGFRGLATMHVMYRNAPNTVPVVLRGNVGQTFKGLLPRTTDLPPSLPLDEEESLHKT